MRGIPSILLDKIKQQYQTKFNNANPRVSVTVARARTTVSDSSYFTVETIREGANLGDVSLAPQRMRTSGTPTRIYEIHIDNGIVGTSIREYPDKLKDGWKDQFTLGAGSKVAMAFDGEWRRYRQLWRLVTHEVPWIFWVDGDGKLQAQLWDDDTTKQELASGVTYVRAIRAWKNLNIADKDQGIVVAYIKNDGKVYYRNYCQLLDLTYLWEPEREITDFTGAALSLNLFITNDYRMGFMIEDSLSNIHWLITDRNWAGMAIAADTLTVAPATLDINLIPIEYINAVEQETLTVAPAELSVNLLYADTNNAVKAINIPKAMINEEEEEYDDWGWIIETTFDHPIPNLNLSQVVATNLDNATTIEMASLDKISDKVYRLNVSNVVESGINNVYGDIKISVVGAINPAGYTYINMEDTFTPLNLVPTFIPLPEVEAIFNE